MSADRSTSGSTAALVSGQVPAAGDNKKDASLWLHVRILYILVTLLTLGCATSVWICVRQVRNLRQDFEGQIVPNGVVEFMTGSDRSDAFYGDVWTSPPGDGDVDADGRRVAFADADLGENTDSPDVPTVDQREEQLLRVKRRANRPSKLPTFFYGDAGPGPVTGIEGSGADMDNMVWLTSYSRIPVFALHQFCAATKDYCPPAPVGPPGPPGDPGPPGQPGRHGIKGDDGVPGESGIPGLPGHNGSMGDPGEKGDPGPPGLLGPPGPRGDPGPTGWNGTMGPPGPQGDPGEDGFNGTAGLPGSKGNKGDTGLIGSPGDQGLVPAGQQCGECPAGPPGPVGPAGEPGSAGPPGAPGQQGEPGFNGTDGRSGRRGRKGPGGMTGLPGAQGETGEPGPRGHKGDTGAVGPVGPSGADASTLNCTCPIMEGHPGPPGLQGLPGPKGDKGDSGCSNQLLETTMEPTTTLEPTTMPATTVEPTIDDREKACRIRMVGKPLFQRYTGTYWGAWMRDPEPVDKDAANKYWFTRHFTGKLLYEYDNEAHFRQDRQPKVYELKELYFGTGHVIYAGAFYYHKAGHNEIVKFDLEKGHTVGRLALPEAAYQGMDYVYDTEYNYLDLAVDENGLWVIYAAEGRPQHLLVSKINADGLFIEKTWTIHVRHQAYGNGFITCGVLYLINSTKAKTTVIEFAYDLYTKTRDHNVRLKFTNPFQQNNMVSYNPKDGRIYSWDKGNQLTYPLLM